MLAVKKGKNPTFDAKSSAKHSKLGEEAGSCCNHSKNPGGGLRALLGGRLLMHFGTQDHNDVLKTRYRVKASCNPPLHLAGGNCRLFRQGCHHQAPGISTLQCWECA